MNKSKKNMLQIAAIILGVILVINAFSFFLKIRYSLYGSFSYTYEDIMRSVDYGDYPLVVDMVYTNETSGKTKKENTEEFLVFAKYYEASMLYRAYSDVGDAQNAKLKKQVMDECMEKLSTPKLIDAAKKLN